MALRPLGSFERGAAAWRLVKDAQPWLSSYRRAAHLHKRGIAH